MVSTLVLVVVVAVACAYFLWPAAVPVVMMKAPGGAGLLISRAAFEANPQLYFQLLRTVGAKAAAAAFAACRRCVLLLQANVAVCFRWRKQNSSST